MSQDLLNRIRTEASQNSISLDDLIKAYKEGSKDTTVTEIASDEESPKPHRIRFSLPTLIAYIGGLVIAIGISIIIGVNWVYYPDPLRLFLTLGLGLSFFMLANGIMLKFSRYSFLANICHLLAGLLIPSGVFYWLSLLPPFNINDNLVLGSVFLGLGLLYLMTDLIFKKGLPILYTLIYLTISFFSFYSLILFNSDLGRSIVDYRLMQWGFLFGSIIYLLLAFCSWNWQRSWFSRLILNIGKIGFYISVFSLVYYIPGYQSSISNGGVISSMDSESITIATSGSKILEFLFGLLYIPFYYLASRINSGGLLLITTLSLITWLIYLNSRYFFGQANFGVGLVTSGLIMIGVSIGSIKLSQWLKKSRKVV